MHYVAQQPTPGHLTIMSARHAATAPPSQLHPMAYQYYAVPPPQPYPMYYPHPYRMAPSSPYTGPVVTARGPPRGGASAYAGATLRPPERGAPPWRAACASDGGNARGNAAICDSTRSAAGTYATLGIVSPSRAIAKRTPARRKRLKWTDELHQKFLSAIEDVGTETAVPKALMLAMDVPGLTRENIASHLQKYRQRVKGQGSAASEPHGSGARADSERASSELAGNKSLPERASGSGGASSNGNQDTAADASAKERSRLSRLTKLEDAVVWVAPRDHRHRGMCVSMNCVERKSRTPTLLTFVSSTKQLVDAKPHSSERAFGSRCPVIDILYEAACKAKNL
eukprot:IDg13513t1